MLQCTGRCARTCIQNLNVNAVGHPSHQPLLFLRPRWCKRKWARSQHTERASSQEYEEQEDSHIYLEADLRELDSPVTTKSPSQDSRSRKERSTYGSKHLTKQVPPQTAVHYAKRPSSQLGLQKTFVTPHELKIKHVTPENARTSWSTLAKNQTSEMIRKIPSLSMYNPSQLQIDLMIRLLLKESQHIESHSESSFSIGTKSLYRLTGTKFSNTWIYGAGSDCLVKVFRPESSKSDRHPVILEGTQRAQELAKEFLLQVEQESSTDNIDSDERKRIGPLQHVSQIPEPAEWNIRTFSDYVRTIVHMPRRQSVERFLYSGTSYNLEAGKALKSLFGRSDLKHCMSTYALAQALRFSRKHTELNTSGTFILGQAKQYGLVPDILVTNEQLSVALANNNAGKFLLVVEEMKQLGIYPNSVTWATLIDYTTSRDQVTELIAELEPRGFLETLGDRRTIARAVVKKEFPFYVEEAGGVRKMKDQMDKTFGQDWLTSRSITQMLDICRLGGSKPEAVHDILQIAREAEGQGVHINIQGIQRMLQVAQKSRSIAAAIHALKMQPLSKNRTEDESVCELVFKLAWERQAFNLSKLVWRYAASVGTITTYMQRKVRNALTRNVVSSYGRLSRDAWDLLAGKVVVGTNMSTSDFESLFGHLSNQMSGKGLDEWMLQWTPDDGQRNDQIMLANLLIERDMNAWRFYKKMKWTRFLELLDRAVKMDEQWWQNSTSSSLSPVELRKNSIQIHLEPRTQSIIFTGEGLDYRPLRRWFVVNDIKLDINTLAPMEDSGASQAATQ